MCSTNRVEVTARNWRVFRKGFYSAHYRGPHLTRERSASNKIVFNIKDEMRGYLLWRCMLEIQSL